MNQALRDRMVCGLLSDSIQKRLLAEADLTLAQVLPLSQGMKAAKKKTQSLKVKKRVIRQINKLSGKGPPIGKDSGTSKRPACYHYGRNNHSSAKCFFRDSECHTCGKKGHIVAVCHSKSANLPRVNQHPKMFGSMK